MLCTLLDGLKGNDQKKYDKIKDTEPANVVLGTLWVKQEPESSRLAGEAA